ncbi:hypothetical protein IQ07DRAFT_272536 [Pyrenochaeta sp. DS3sAY3a]|nr:hypothetical protein IQ07DRAFT_272536 [Pyrenochaeta sp. DS3sAY3a]
MAGAIPPGTDLTRTALGRNPDGSDPNFENPPTLAAVTYGVTCTMMVLTSGVVVLRILSAIKKERSIKIDDYCCVLALLLTTAYGILIMLMNRTARHSWDTPVSAIDESWLKKNAALCLLYGPAMFFAKAAICTLYLRIFKTVQWMKWCAWGALVVLGCIFWAMVPIYAVYSFPYGDEEWNLNLALKTGRMDRLTIGICAVNVASDLFLLVIPLPIIIKLNLSFQKRIGLAAVFMTGIIATATTALGLYFRISMWQSKSDIDRGDATWVAAALYITVVVELYATITVSCVPGCVSSWRNIIRETTVVTTLRSMINSSKASLRSKEASHHAKSLSIRSEEADISHKDEYELQNPHYRETGIIKTIKIQQTEV